jgi:predicted permease
MLPIVGALAAWALRAGGAEDHPATVAAFHALDVLGKSASPLGIFVLGLFLGGHFLGGQPLGAQPLGAQPLGAERAGGGGLVGQLAFALIRLALVPALTLGFALALRASVPIDQDTLRTLVLLSSVPAAISTFAMAEHAKAEPEAVARAIVTTSIASFVTIPLWLALTSALA